MRRLLGVLAKPLLKIPFLRRRYLVRLLDHLERTPAAELPPELRPVQAALKRLPKAQRLTALEAGVQQGADAETVPSRSLRRAAERQARRNR